MTVRNPTGLEDLLLRESRASDPALALELFARLVHGEDQAAPAFGELPAADGEALLLWLRRAALGDLVRAEAHCAAPTCGARVDVNFRIGEYLAAHPVRRPKNLRDGDKAGWFGLAGESVQFRLPTCADLVAIEREPDPCAALLRRTIMPAGGSVAPAGGSIEAAGVSIVPAGGSGRLRKRIEDAMERMAPRLSRSISGTCPECAQAFDLFFDVASFVLRELRNHAAGIYQDVHLLALHYKWPERQILEMPRSRRIHYAAMLRDQGVAA